MQIHSKYKAKSQGMWNAGTVNPLNLSGLVSFCRSGGAGNNLNDLIIISKSAQCIPRSILHTPEKTIRFNIYIPVMESGFWVS